MGFLDKLLGHKLLGRRDEAADMAAERSDSAEQGVDKAAEMAAEKTGGEHTEHVDSAADTAKDAIDDA